MNILKELREMLQREAPNALADLSRTREDDEPYRPGTYVGALEARIAELEAEITRLRETLEEIADHRFGCECGSPSVALKALEGKP